MGISSRWNGEEDASSHRMVRERGDAMSHFGKNLWSEVARLPRPLDSSRWSTTGRSGDAVGGMEQKVP